MTARSKWRLEGALLSNAMARTYADGTHTVLALIAQTGPLPVLAERCYGTGAAASYAASSAARDMRQGQSVMVYGQGLRMDHWHGQPVLRMEAIDHLELYGK